MTMDRTNEKIARAKQKIIREIGKDNLTLDVVRKQFELNQYAFFVGKITASTKEIRNKATLSILQDLLGVKKEERTNELEVF